ncbi:hypothetical protein Tsubulata_036333 [Turnera subulata]|uniref:Uncharacterized protein n=1 Tax=Turnera subulata TaxID=218843 RepID=A0A9Q0FLJ5_9ROSI|nr:hypothetical protein Tsubulata_036333 [Turnera subulata]
MGIISRGFSFFLGSAFGIFLAQNYNVPDVRELAYTALERAKEIERTYRKTKKQDEND